MLTKTTEPRNACAADACFLGLKNNAASPQQYATTLQPALDALQGGTPLMLIDGYARPEMPLDEHARILGN